MWWFNRTDMKINCFKILILLSYMATNAGILQAQQGQDYNFNNPGMQAIAGEESKPGWVFIKPGVCCVHQDSFFTLHQEAFGLGIHDQMILLGQIEEPGGLTHRQYQQFHKGIKVEKAIYRLHARDLQVYKANGLILPGLDIEIASAQSNEAARQAALNHIGAKTYAWENEEEERLLKEIRQDNKATYFPTGELILTSISDSMALTPDNYALAYRFDIYTLAPPDAQSVYVNALDGTILKTVSLITSCSPGQGCTLYNSTQQYDTESTSSGFRLFDDCRGNGIHTKFNSAEVYNTTNTWATNCPSTSAHWAAEKTYDYFLQKHNRNSFNGSGALMYNAVTNNGCDNAYWNGVHTTYLQGCTHANNYLVSLDVVGHEWGHAVTNTSANLTYSGESGGLNESFSDIFGTMVECFADPINCDYLIGEDMWVAGGKLRDMKNPKSKNNPDTYQGTYWNLSVHNASSVSNHWFYLLSEGSSLTDGVNDHGYAFSVSGIGQDKAAAIAYRNLTVYLTPSSNFADARQGAIEAARDLFGNCSNEVVQTAAAWSAVGVYAPAVIAINLDACGNFINTTDPNVFIATQTLRAGNICSATHTTVHSGGTLVLKAANSVELKPGFWAKPGSFSHAYIMNCTPGSY